METITESRWLPLVGLGVGGVLGTVVGGAGGYAFGWLIQGVFSPSFGHVYDCGGLTRQGRRRA
jgi:hypothetical protein